MKAKPKPAQRPARRAAIFLRITPETMELAQRCAAARQWSLSHLADVALKEHLANNGYTTK